jgi:hypothetical protein
MPGQRWDTVTGVSYPYLGNMSVFIPMYVQYMIDAPVPSLPRYLRRRRCAGAGDRRRGSLRLWGKEGILELGSDVIPSQLGRYDLLYMHTYIYVQYICNMGFWRVGPGAWEGAG